MFALALVILVLSLIVIAGSVAAVRVLRREARQQRVLDTLGQSGRHARSPRLVAAHRA